MKTLTMSMISDIFNPNLFFWKMFGIWPGRVTMRFYKYYTFVYLFITLFGYNVLLTVNLIYTPLNIDALIRELIFYFAEIVVTIKVLIVIVKRDSILKIFDLLDSEEFQGDANASSAIVERSKRIYTAVYTIHNIISNVSYFSQVLAPIIVNLILGDPLSNELPISKYYFLNDESLQKYFVFWFIYQSIGMYGHMIYNISCDGFLVGILYMAETQFRMINFKLVNFDKELKSTHDIRNEDKQVMALKKCLRHYHLVLKYCSSVQDLINVIMFFQFGIGSSIICVALYGLLLPSKTETIVSMIIYLMVITLEIFMPAWLGTKINYESQQLSFAAYNINWISRSKPFKRNIMIFVERANIPIQMSGMKLFPLSLDTFTSIMKTAYSLFTLIRNVQEPDLVNQ